MKRFFAVLGILCVALGMVGGVLADQGIVEATVTLTGQPLAVEPQNIDFDSIELTGKFIADQPGVTEAWQLNDPTGTGAGYHIMINAVDFVSGEHTISVDNFWVMLDDENIEAEESDNEAVAPASTIPEEFIPLNDSDQMLLNAGLGEGQGVWNFTPSFKLDIPADTYAGEYTSDVTVTITAGPEAPQDGEGGEG